MKIVTALVLAVLALGALSITVTAEDMQPSVSVGMVTDYAPGSSITVNDEYSGASHTYIIAGDALIDGNVTVGTYVEVEAEGNRAVFIGVITREDDE